MIARRLALPVVLAVAVVLAVSVAHSEPFNTDGMPPYKVADCPGYCAKTSPDDPEKCTDRCIKRVKRMRASWPNRCWKLCPPDRR